MVSKLENSPEKYAKRDLTCSFSRPFKCVVHCAEIVHCIHLDTCINGYHKPLKIFNICVLEADSNSI
jgi:hypothetical protein